TAVSESKPSSLNAFPGSMSTVDACPSTAATWPDTSSTTRSSRSATGVAASRSARPAGSAFAAATTARLAGAVTSPRNSGAPAGVPVGGEGVHEGVRGRVVRLSRAAEQPGGAGEQHERGEVGVAGQLVEVHGGVDLGPQHLVQASRVQRADDAVVEHPGGVHD